MKRNDILLLISILLLAVLSFTAYRFLNRKPGDVVQITVDSKVVKTLPLDTDVSYTVRTANQGENIIQIKEGTACVSEANCPDKLCVHQKKISKQGENIICLPHKLVISVLSSKKSVLDDVAQ